MKTKFVAKDKYDDLIGLTIALGVALFVVLMIAGFYNPVEKIQDLEKDLTECQDNFCKQERVFVYDKCVEDGWSVPCDKFTTNLSNEDNYIKGHLEYVYNCEVIE